MLNFVHLVASWSQFALTPSLWLYEVYDEIMTDELTILGCGMFLFA